MIRWAWVFARTVAKTAEISVPTVWEAALGRLTRERVDERLQAWSRALLRYAEIELEVRGRENWKPGAPYVVMSNHPSNYDIPVLFQVVPGPLRMVAKTELFRVPIWGRAMRVSGFVEIDRKRRERAFQSLRVAGQRLASGLVVWIAPEGTRSRTGELLPFKKGGFVVAEQMQVPIVPVSIQGTREVLPPGSFKLRTGRKVTVTFHPPIPCPAQGGREEWMRQVRAAIQSGLSPELSSDA
jgi:1-acyl-sn-glycerol-3-phosphate acyltransferase